MAFGWDDLALLAVSAWANYGSGSNTAPGAPGNPSNFYGANGAMQFWDPRRNGYISLDPRTPTSELASNWGNRLIMNKMMGIGGYDTTLSNLNSEIEALKGRYSNGGSGEADREILQRIRDLTSTRDNLKDVNIGYSAIGQTDPTTMLKYKGATDTVNNYLTSTLDDSYKSASDMAAQTQAKRGMAQSTMADWGRDEMARKYATDKTGVAVQSEQYFQQLKAADEAAKLNVLGAAQSGLGLDASLAAGRSSASQAQMSLAQQLASYNNELKYNWQQQHDSWRNQQNKLPWQTLAGVGKMAAGGYYGGTQGMLGMNPSLWGEGWNGKFFNGGYGSVASGNNPNSGR